MGLVGIEEAAVKVYGSLSLHLCLKFGILVKDEKNSQWELAKDYKTKRAYLFGDVKTINNIDKIVAKSSDHPLDKQKQCLSR